MAFPLYPLEALILPFDGSNGSTTFTDYSAFGHTLTASGNVAISTAQSKFGGASAYFDGTGDFLTVTSPNDFYLAGDFTIEAWVRADDFTSQNRYVFSNTNSLIELYLQATTGFLVASLSGLTIVDTVGVPALTQTHVALCRVGSTVTLYKNGAVVGSVTKTGPLALTNMLIGTQVFSVSNDVSSKFKGYIDDFLMTKTAKYYGAFTPSVSANSTTPTVITVATSLKGSATKKLMGGIPTPVSLRTTKTPLLAFDMYNGGLFKVAGTVKEAGTPDAPVKRRVRLHRKSDGMLLRETWSAADGSYVFTAIAKQLCYVVSFDHTGNYNAVIKDSITPDAMP